MASEAFKVRRNIFGRFWKYLENRRKSLEVAGTFSEIQNENLRRLTQKRLTGNLCC